MARSVPPGRLRDVGRAATRVFIAKGYRRALMTDVAQGLKLSSGSLYNYVESKEALFYVALLSAMSPAALDDLTMPVRTPPSGEIMALVDKWLTEKAAFPVLAAALDRRRPKDIRAELEAVINERYTFVEDSRRLLALVEQSAFDLPELADLYYRESRRASISTLAEYLERRGKQGHLRRVPDAPTAARFVIESVAWFAWHRKGDPDSAMIDDGEARNTVRHMLTSALLP